MWPALIAAALGIGAYQTDWGKDLLGNLFGTSSQYDQAYQDALAANQQAYDDYIKLMQEEATKNMPFQQGLLWQLMTGGDLSQLDKFIWGDQWANQNVPDESSVVDVPTSSVSSKSSDDEGQSFADWRDNVYEEIYTPFRAFGRDIEKFWKNGIIGNIEHAYEDIGGNVGSWFQDAVINNAVNYLNKYPGLEFDKSNLPTWLGGDSGVLGDPGLGTVATWWERLGGGADNTIGDPIETISNAGSAVGDALSNAGSAVSSIFGLGKPEPTPDTLPSSPPPEADWSKYKDAIGNLLNQGYKLKNIIVKEMGGYDIAIIGESPDGKEEKFYFQKEDLFPDYPFEIGDIKFDPDTFGVELVRDENAYSPYENMLFDIYGDNKTITEIELSPTKDEILVYTKNDKGEDEVITRPANEIFPDIDFRDISGLSFDPATSILTPTFTPREVDQVKYNNKSGTIKIEYSDGSSEKATFEDIFPDLDRSTIDNVYYHNGKLYATEKTEGGIYIGDQKITTDTGAEITGLDYDEKTKELVFKGADGTETRKPITDIFPEVDPETISNVVFGSGNLKVFTSSGEEGATPVEAVSSPVVSADTSIPSDVIPKDPPLSTAGWGIGGYLSQYAPDVKNEFIAGSSLGDLMLSGWKQDSQSMLGDAARLEKEGLQQVTNLAAFRNPYGFAGSAEGVARDLEQNTIIPTKLEALRYPQTMTDQAIMSTLGELMNEPMLNYPMPATVQPNYYPAASTQQLTNLGITSLTSLLGAGDSMKLALDYLKTRNTPQTTPSFVSPTSPTMVYSQPSYISSYPAY